ncbi:MAG TPA: YihY family inner membrane protein [Rubrivivax sp.]|nr:YihY family inner membrane protein [Rubrivivax sp.]
MSSANGLWRGATEQFANLLQTLRSWPWFETARTLRHRFREDRLGISASSLTFTTLIALVPLVTVMLALFSAFPVFARFQGALQQYFLQSLVPDGIAKPVLGTLNQFAAQANRLGGAGLVFLLISALALMLTIDRTLNGIWRVRKPRPIAQRVLMYWAAITLGPLLLGISLSVSSYALTVSRGIVDALPGGLTLALQTLEFVLLWCGVAALFRYVPNTDVRWRHALAGGLFVAVGLELAKRLLAWYVAAMPGFSVIYGAFATLPILLLWIYLSWLTLLFGAVVAAYAPSLQMHLVRHADLPGQRFALALELLRELRRARRAAPHGLTIAQLAASQRADPLQVEPLMELLLQLGWVGRLDDEAAKRHVLLCDDAAICPEPLIDRLLLARDARTAAFRQRAAFGRMTLDELLAEGH